MAKTVTVRVKVKQMIQLNKFEPIEVELEEIREDVPVNDAVELRKKLFKRLMQECVQMTDAAIETYRDPKRKPN